MEETARRYARRILLIHLLLLAVVLGLVALASREIYSSTRDEVISQARARQALLVSQTARGIESYYQSILNNLDLLRRAENEEGATTAPAAAAPTTAPDARPSAGDRAIFALARGNIFGSLLWKQLQGRVSLLIGLDRAQLSRTNPSVRVIGSDDAANDANAQAERLVTSAREWLEGVEKPSVSGYRTFDGEGVNVVCVPFPHVPEPIGLPPREGEGGPIRGGGGGGGRLGGMFRGQPPPPQPPAAQSSSGQPPRDSFRMLLAVVPIREIETRFLKTINDDPDTGAWLIDENLTAMAASKSQLVGVSMGDISDPGVRATAADYVKNSHAGSTIIDRSFNLGGTTFAPSLVSAEPIKIGDKSWELFIATSMGQVDGVVSQLFHRALYWGGFVVVCVTAILVSTAVQMIRGRVRLERVRHEVLNRELTQAREIQLAWLPDHRPPTKAIDIAAINSPASHISGDFYNWFELPDGRLVVTIGDVTGHGMSAAFLMATTQLLIRNTMARVGDPGLCLTEVNRQLCVQVFNGQFVTMLILVADVASGSLQVSTAGHPAPLLADGESFQSLPLEPQLVLGVERTTTYVTEKFQLPAQSSILLYTDGVVECLGGPDQQSRFGAEGLQRTLYGKYDNAQAMLDRVIGAVDNFRGDLDLTDDLTLVALQLQATRVAVAGVAAAV